MQPLPKVRGKKLTRRASKPKPKGHLTGTNNAKKAHLKRKRLRAINNYTIRGNSSIPNASTTKKSSKKKVHYRGNIFNQGEYTQNSRVLTHGNLWEPFNYDLRENLQPNNESSTSGNDNNTSGNDNNTSGIENNQSGIGNKQSGIGNNQSGIDPPFNGVLNRTPSEWVPRSSAYENLGIHNRHINKPTQEPIQHGWWTLINQEPTIQRRNNLSNNPLLHTNI